LSSQSESSSRIFAPKRFMPLVVEYFADIA
jgi:hypothetical protein